MKLENLIGKKFGELTVIAFDEERLGRTRWIVQCSCDNKETFSVLSYNLKSGNTTTCGRSIHMVKDISGKNYGTISVIKFDRSDGVHSWWKCFCNSCKNFVSIRSDILQSGIKSCGCKTESNVASVVKKYLQDNYLNVSFEHRVCKNPKTNRWLRCDIYIGIPYSLNGAYIEIHGSQHYRLGQWHYRLAKEKETTPEDELKDQKYRDKIKKKYAKKNGVYIEIDLRKIKTAEEAIKYIEEILDI